MSVQHIHTFLCIWKATGKVKIVGTTVSLTGGMFDLLSGIYAKSDTECDVDITFSPTSDGKQQNDCRDLVVAYMSKPDVPKGRKIAERLAEHSDGRSGLGLLFLIAGKEARDHKIVLSRFPTDSAIYVDENPGTLSVQFLERVFMKSKTSYKAVIYRHSSLQGGFWSGRAIDKQLNTLSGEPSNYWINDFLLSDFTTTPAMGDTSPCDSPPGRGEEGAARSQTGIDGSRDARERSCRTTAKHRRLRQPSGTFRRCKERHQKRAQVLCSRARGFSVRHRYLQEPRRLQVG